MNDDNEVIVLTKNDIVGNLTSHINTSDVVYELHHDSNDE